MLYVVEGIDRTGKSTMCNAIQKATNGKIIDFSKQLGIMQRTMKNASTFSEALFCAQYIFAKTCFYKHDLIFHRFYPSREMYSKFNNQDKIIDVDPTELPYHVIFYLKCDILNIVKRAEKENEDLTPERVNILKKLDEEMDWYMNSLAMNHEHLYVVEVDTTKFNDDEDYYNYVQNWINNSKELLV